MVAGFRSAFDPSAGQEGWAYVHEFELALDLAGQVYCLDVGLGCLDFALDIVIALERGPTDSCD